MALAGVAAVIKYLIAVSSARSSLRDQLAFGEAVSCSSLHATVAKMTRPSMKAARRETLLHPEHVTPRP
jgi:hypothetical protein